MAKTLGTKNLIARGTLLAILTVSLATVGCTTDRRLGWGPPGTSGPALRVTPTSGISTGVQAAPMPPPMTSSYTGIRDSDRAAQIMAQHAAFSAPRVRVLGVLTSLGARGPDASNVNVLGTRTMGTRTMMGTQGGTINSSLVSPGGTPAIISGVGNAEVAPIFGSRTGGGAFVAGATVPAGGIPDVTVPTVPNRLVLPGPVAVSNATFTPTNGAQVRTLNRSAVSDDTRNSTGGIRATTVGGSVVVTNSSDD